MMQDKSTRFFLSLSAMIGSILQKQKRGFKSKNRLWWIIEYMRCYVFGSLVELFFLSDYSFSQINQNGLRSLPMHVQKWEYV